MIQYQILFVVNFLISVLLMKLMSWALTAPEKKPPLLAFLFLTPYLSVRSEKYESPLRTYSLISVFLLYFFLMMIFVVVGQQFLSPLNYLEILLVCPAIFFFTEAIGALAQILYSWKQKKIFPIHYRPLASPSLSQFWGRRWNLWVQDWLKDLSQALGRRSRVLRIITTFLISGLFHEVMVNLPYWITTGESYFGTMLLYFLIQAAGLYADKKFMKHRPPILRRIFMWIMVILPSPLFINVPLLTFFGMTNSLN